MIGRRSLIGVLCLALLASAFASDEADSSAPFTYKKPEIPTGDNVVYVETFDDDGASKRWTLSAAPEFTGEWTFSEGKSEYNFTGDKFLIAENKARRHAISTRLPKVFDPTDKTIVVQYEVQLQNGQECGGAYIKLLTKDENRKDDAFDNNTPYTIMFGPDKCGSNDKIHFIFRHQNPITKEFEEKHLKAPPQSKTDKLTHLYTLIVRPDNSYAILVDRLEVARGSLLMNFQPAVNPPKEIDDPEDKKPVDWVDQKTISDPDATKPEEWDDRKTIPDPDAEKPADWNDEDDGEWEVPDIPNPDYRGEWAPPQLPNPAYKGEWAPRKIANPNFFEDSHPHNFNLIDGIGIELWTMSEGISFNNILMAYDEKVAEEFAEKTWRPRNEAEKKIAATKSPVPESEFSKMMKEYFDYIVQFANEHPYWFAGSIAAGIGPVALIFALCGGFGGSDKTKPSSKKTAAKKKDDDVSSDSDDSDEDEKQKEKPVIGKEKKIEELPDEPAASTDKKDSTLRKRKT